MDSPELVNLVKPPTIIIKKTNIKVILIISIIQSSEQDYKYFLEDLLVGA